MISMVYLARCCCWLRVRIAMSGKGPVSRVTPLIFLHFWISSNWQLTNLDTDSRIDSKPVVLSVSLKTSCSSFHLQGNYLSRLTETGFWWETPWQPQKWCPCYPMFFFHPPVVLVSGIMYHISRNTGVLQTHTPVWYWHRFGIISPCLGK